MNDELKALNKPWQPRDFESLQKVVLVSLVLFLCNTIKLGQNVVEGNL